MTIYNTKGCRCPILTCTCSVSSTDVADSPKLPDGLSWRRLVGSFGCGLLQDSSNLTFDKTKNTPRYTEAQKEDLLRMALTTEKGKLALGQAMANPIRRSLPYQGVGRNLGKNAINNLPPLVDRNIDFEQVQNPTTYKRK